MSYSALKLRLTSPRAPGIIAESRTLSPRGSVAHAADEVVRKSTPSNRPPWFARAASRNDA